MARPQGIETPLMSPLGSSLKVATNPEFNTVLDTFEDVMNVNGSGVVLMKAVRASARTGVGTTSIDYRSNYNVDNSGLVLIPDYGLNQTQNIAETSGFNIFTQYRTSFQFQAKHISVAASINPYLASIWYADKLTPQVPLKFGDNPLTIIPVDVANNDAWFTVLDYTNGGGQTNYIELKNDDVSGTPDGIYNMAMRLTFDGVVLLFDLLNDKHVLPPNELFAYRAGILNFPLKWINSFKFEIKVADAAHNSTKFGRVHYSVDQ